MTDAERGTIHVEFASSIKIINSFSENHLPAMGLAGRSVVVVVVAAAVTVVAAAVTVVAAAVTVVAAAIVMAVAIITAGQPAKAASSATVGIETAIVALGFPSRRQDYLATILVIVRHHAFSLEKFSRLGASSQRNSGHQYQ
ncbi:MAG TPA: hypothetical protein PKY50_14055 [Candidatus Competibacter sp.]|nr:hypothetical protein [Candidatus Competibacter sp.]